MEQRLTARERGRPEKRICKGFASRLAGLIVERGVKKAALAERCGVSAGAVTCWCNGINEPPLSAVVQLAASLSVSTDYLLVGASDELSHARIDDLKLRVARLEREVLRNS